MEPYGKTTNQDHEATAVVPGVGRGFTYSMEIRPKMGGVKHQGYPAGGATNEQGLSERAT